MLRYVYVSARCPRRFCRLRRRLFHKAEIVGVEPRYPLPLPMMVPGGQSGWQQHQHVAHFDVRANPRQLHLPRPSPRRRPPHHCRSLAAAAAVVVGLLEHTIVVVAIFIVVLLFLRLVRYPVLPSTRRQRQRCCWRAPSIDGVVLPVAATPCSLLFCPLSVIDKNDDNSNINRVLSMIVTVEDIISAPSKFPAVPSAGTTTAATAATAQTPCDDKIDKMIGYDPQLTSFGAYLCPRRLQQSTTKESTGRQQCCIWRMRRENKVEPPTTPTDLGTAVNRLAIAA